jgi:hypothetical protein
MSATVRRKEADMVAAAGKSLAVHREAAGPLDKGKIRARPPHLVERRPKGSPPY